MTEPAWIDPYGGFQLAADTVVVAAAHQTEKLACVGIDPAVFGPHADPSFFIGLAIRAGINSGISAQGAVNMVQSLEVHRRPLLDELLEVGGRINSVREVPRGHSVDTEVWFSDMDGTRVITANRTSLRPDPAKRGARGAGQRTAPVVTAIAELHLGPTYTLSPDGVKRYSSEGNSIHYDPDAALAAGFRAPLIGGGMGVHFLMADLWVNRAPQRFACDIYFRRPIFWDESVTVGVLGDYDACALIKAVDGDDDSHPSQMKVATEIAFHQISCAAG